MMLVRLERISPEDLRRCQEAFNRLDVSKNGQLDWRTVDAVRARRASEQLQRAQPLDCGWWAARGQTYQLHVVSCMSSQQILVKTKGLGWSRAAQASP